MIMSDERVSENKRSVDGQADRTRHRHTHRILQYRMHRHGRQIGIGIGRRSAAAQQFAEAVLASLRIDTRTT